MMETARMLMMLMMVWTSTKLISNAAMMIKVRYVVSMVMGFLTSNLSLFSSSYFYISIIINAMVILIVASSTIFPFYKINAQDCLVKGNLVNDKDTGDVDEMLHVSINGGDKALYEVEEVINAPKDGIGSSYSAKDDHLFRDILVDEVDHIKARKYKNGMYSDDMMIELWVNEATHESKRQMPRRQTLFRKSKGRRSHVLESTTSIEDSQDVQEIEKIMYYDHGDVEIKKSVQHLNKTSNQDHHATMDETWKMITDAKNLQEGRGLNQLRRSNTLSVNFPKSNSTIQDHDDKDPKTEVDELNKRAEEFINKFRRNISLQEAKI